MLLGRAARYGDAEDEHRALEQLMHAQPAVHVGDDGVPREVHL